MLVRPDEYLPDRTHVICLAATVLTERGDECIKARRTSGNPKILTAILTAGHRTLQVAHRETRRPAAARSNCSAARYRSPSSCQYQ